MLCGGLLATVLLAVQLSGSPLGAGLVFPRTGGGIGNLAQPNHLANYLWLGIASAIYLHAQGRLGAGADRLHAGAGGCGQPHRFA